MGIENNDNQNDIINKYPDLAKTMEDVENTLVGEELEKWITEQELTLIKFSLDNEKRKKEAEEEKSIFLNQAGKDNLSDQDIKNEISRIDENIEKEIKAENDLRISIESAKKRLYEYNTRYKKTNT